MLFAPGLDEDLMGRKKHCGVVRDVMRNGRRS